MNAQKIEEIFSDKTFVKSLLKLETAEEVQKSLDDLDIQMTEKDILTMHDILSKVMNGTIPSEKIAQWKARYDEGEITDEMLELVAGGTDPSMIIGIICLMAVAACGIEE